MCCSSIRGGGGQQVGAGKEKKRPHSEKKVQINTQRRKFFLFNEAETPEDRWREPAADKRLDCREVFTSQTIKLTSIWTKRPNIFFAVAFRASIVLSLCPRPHYYYEKY